MICRHATRLRVVDLTCFDDECHVVLAYTHLKRAGGGGRQKNSLAPKGGGGGGGSCPVKMVLTVLLNEFSRPLDVRTFPLARCVVSYALCAIWQLKCRQIMKHKVC